MALANDSAKEALLELDRVAPNAPFLALGQTVFWDEPMKAGVMLAMAELGSSREFVAGIHDTDYFAKHVTGTKPKGRFKTVAHNDTTTKGLWSAAAEFSTLFGSETVVTRDILQTAGLRLRKISQNRPTMLDEATEAWGWRGIVTFEEKPPVAAEVPLHELFPELHSTLDWAIDSTLASVSEPDRRLSQERAEQLRSIFCNGSEDELDLSLGGFYERIVPDLYSFVAGCELAPKATATTQLLRFNRATCALDRFKLVDVFVNPATRSKAVAIYNHCIKGSEMYGLDRFGSGAIPFDLVIPKLGRGTIRIGNRGIVIGTRQPQFISLKRPVTNLLELAQAIEGKFGADCTLIGKAVTLIGMLAREFVFVFHEGASGYVSYSRKLHDALREAGMDVTAFPILRVSYDAWDSLGACFTFLRLPEPFQRAFGSEELCAPSFAARWREVCEEQEALLAQLGELRGPMELIQFLDRSMGGFWNRLADEYERLHSQLGELETKVNLLKDKRREAYADLRAKRRVRIEAEKAKGNHFRSAIFERQASEKDLAERQRLAAAVEDAIHAVSAAKQSVRDLMHAQKEIVSDPQILAIHERRRAIELEAELKRLRLIRHAVITARGLRQSNKRPSAWWLPIVSPDGRWFDAAIAQAEFYLEPLIQTAEAS